MKPIKRHVKRGIQHLAARFGPHTRRGSSPRLLILMYHRVLPAGDTRINSEEPGMYVTPETLNNHINYISQFFVFINLNEWLNRKKQGLSLPMNACTVTFDDGWADNYEFAFPVLQANQVPATIFLVSDFIGTRRTFWPERIFRLVEALNIQPGQQANPVHDWLYTLAADKNRALQPGPETGSTLIANAKAFADDRLLELLDESETALGIDDSNRAPALLNWEQVREMLDSGLVEAGSHTRHHTRLGDTGDAAVLEDEIVGSKRIIEEHIGMPVTTFCFPNGDYSQAALDIVRRNYSGAVTTEGGWNTVQSGSHVLKRIGVHEDSTNDRTAFLARISGWM